MEQALAYVCCSAEESRVKVQKYCRKIYELGYVPILSLIHICNLYGSVGKTWRTLVLTTGNSKQDIGVFESETAAPVSFSVQWLNMTRIELMKKDVNTQNLLSGAVYGIYTDKKCENLLMTMSATGRDGKAVSDYFDSALKTVYVKEITCLLYTSRCV